MARKDNTEENRPISPDEMAAALQRSGYLVEGRVESLLRDRGWFAEANDTYRDRYTGKMREFDVHAIRGVRVSDDIDDWLFAVLAVECINNPQPFVVLTKQPVAPKLLAHDVTMSGLPVMVPDETIYNGWKPLPEFLDFDSFHHYCKTPMGTQFCSFAMKKGAGKPEWMASHDESQFECIRQLPEIVDYLINTHYGSWVIGHEEPINLQVYYPILIVQGDLLAALTATTGVTFSSADHLLIQRTFLREHIEQRHYIDVVQERKLADVLKVIQAEAKTMALRLGKKLPEIRDAIKELRKGLPAADSDLKADVVRQVLERSR
jgi:hypothetical protein